MSNLDSTIKFGQPRAFFIRRRQPWVWKLFFPGVEFKNMAFTWGDTVYYSGESLSKDVVAHEKAHVQQQKFSKFYGFFCILLYKWNKSYRRKCEIGAFTAQYRVNGDLDSCASKLSSLLYGSLMTFEEAKAVIHLCASSV